MLSVRYIAHVFEQDQNPLWLWLHDQVEFLVSAHILHYVGKLKNIHASY